MNDISKKELELDKLSATFKELKDGILRLKKVKSEYSQAAIILLRNVFTERWQNSATSESALNLAVVSGWVANSTKPPKQGWYIVYIVGYGKNPIIDKCEFLGGGWWRHQNFGTIDEHVTHWHTLPEPPCR